MELTKEIIEKIERGEEIKFQVGREVYHFYKDKKNQWIGNVYVDGIIVEGYEYINKEDVFYEIQTI